jgi:hypothetical protein
MSAPAGELLAPSIPKCLAVAALSYALFSAGCFVLGMPLGDLLAWVFLVAIAVPYTAAFALGLYLMLRTRIGPDGLCPAVPTFYQRTIRWPDLVAVRQARGFPLFCVARGYGWGIWCVLPRPWLLKRPAQLAEVLCRYAPPDHPLRTALAVCPPPSTPSAAMALPRNTR